MCDEGGLWVSQTASTKTRRLVLISSFRYVGNTMATFVMQALGCAVAALNTVHFSTLACPSSISHPFANPPFPFPSTECLLCLILVAWILRTTLAGNHTGYGQFKGTKASAQEIRDIYNGLRQSYLTDFDVLLSGYAPSAEAVEAVGVIARDLRFKSTNKPGSFFWIRLSCSSWAY